MMQYLAKGRVELLLYDGVLGDVEPEEIVITCHHTSESHSKWLFRFWHSHIHGQFVAALFSVTETPLGNGT